MQPWELGEPSYRKWFLGEEQRAVYIFLNPSGAFSSPRRITVTEAVTILY